MEGFAVDEQPRYAGLGDLLVDGIGNDLADRFTERSMLNDHQTPSRKF